MSLRKMNTWVVGVDYSKTRRFMFGKGDAKGLKSYLLDPSSQLKFLYQYSSYRDNKLSLTNGSTVEGKSFKYPESFTAEPVDLIVVEDADTISQDFYLQFIRPRITDSKGRIWINGRMPLKRNWLVSLWQKYFNKPSTDYAYSFQFSMYDNPNVEVSEIENLANDLPPHLRRCIIMGEPPEVDSSIFGDLEKSFVGSIEGYNPSHTYQAGIDIGRTHDRTVLAISDLTSKRLANIDIFPPKFFQTDKVEERVLKNLKAYHSPLTYLDTSSIGTQFEYLTSKYDFIKPYPINCLKLRNSVIDNVSIALERGFTIPFNQYVKNELSNLNLVIRNSYVLYVPETGYHDDSVIAIGLSLINFANRFDTSISQVEVVEVKGDVAEDDFLKHDFEPLDMTETYAL